MAHRIKVKIYYEDTDAGGVVYYANYLRYLERARTEFCMDNGIDIHGYHGEGAFFVVSHVDIHYRRPAQLGDTLEITTEIAETKNASLTMKHGIWKNETLMAEALVTLVHVDVRHRPRRLPSLIRERFSGLYH